MAGYSETPLAKKLDIREGDRVALLGAPLHFETELNDRPADIELKHDLRGTRRFHVLLLFAKDMAALHRQWPRASARMEPAAGLWVAWPKKDSGVQTDLTDSIVREHGLSTGLVDNKVCAINETWSALRFVIRKENR